MELLQKVKPVNRTAHEVSSMALPTMYSGAVLTLRQLNRARSKI
jgi:hypothetical protein